MMLHLPLATQHATDDPAAAVVRRQLAAIGGLVAKASKVVVVSGAGVSCSCGIPDFRSADGLYNLVKSRYPSTVVQGKDLFSSGLFRSPESTSLFFSFIAELKAAVDLVEPSRTHRFVRRLEERGKLARSYTQNIDGLERRAGVRCSSTLSAPLAAAKAEGSSALTSSEPSSAATSAWSSALSSQASSRSPSPPPSSFPSASTSANVTPPADVPSSPAPPVALPVGTRIPPPELDKRSTKNVQLHGDIHALRCTVCAASYAFSPEWVELYKEGDCVDCPACEDRVGQRVARGQRALSQGVLRPGIVLYDENHPSGDLIGSLQSYDIQRAPDLLLVLGTSLKVHGLKRLVKELAKAVHSLPATKTRPEGGRGRVIFVNKTAPGKEWDGVFDAWVEGDCDDWVDGVEREWRRVRGRDFEAQSTLVGLGKSVKPAAAAVAGKPPKAKAPAGGKAKKKLEAGPTAASGAGPSSSTPRATPAPLVKKRSATPLSARPSSSALSPTKTTSRLLSAVPRPSAPSSPLPMLSSPASAPAHVLSPAQRAVNVPSYLAPLAPPAFSVRQAEGAKSPKKKQRLLAGSTSKGKGRAYSDEDDDDENSDDDILLVERDDLTGAVKFSPLGRFAALPPTGSTSTPRRLPPPQFKSSRDTPGSSSHATPRAALPSTANGARKRPPGTPVSQSPFMVRPAPAALALASTKKGAAGRAGRALGRAETARAREGVLEAAGVVGGPAGRPRRKVEVIEVE